MELSTYDYLSTLREWIDSDRSYVDKNQSYSVLAPTQDSNSGLINISIKENKK